MDCTLWIVLAVALAIALSIGALIVRRSLVAERFCVKCERLTIHRRDYGVGPVMSYIMAWLTLGWQSMTNQYYPFRCGACGTAYQQKAAEEKFHEPRLHSDSEELPLEQWTGTGGVQKWDNLKSDQKLFLIFMIGLGLAFFVLYWLFRVK